MYIRIRLWEGITLCPTIFSNEIIQWHSKNHYSATNRKIWHYSKNPRIPVFLFTFYYLHAKFEKKNFWMVQMLCSFVLESPHCHLEALLWFKLICKNSFKSLRTCVCLSGMRKNQPTAFIFLCTTFVRSANKELPI